MNKYPGLLEEFGHLQSRLKAELHYPASRKKSRVLSLLPENTAVYAAAPNYGDVLHQALQILQEERKNSAPLRDWMQHNDFTDKEQRIETALEKSYLLSQYLGDEIVITGSSKDPANSLLLIAEIKKPGLKAFLAQLPQDWMKKSDVNLRVLDAQELASAKDGPKHEPVILVRSDYLVVATNVSALRSFNANLDHSAGKFTATAFGQRVEQSYRNGASLLLAANLHDLLDAVPRTPKQDQVIEQAGFENVKYLILEDKDISGEFSSQSELTFSSPRHGVASWLAAPSHNHGLEFVSPDAGAVISLVLKNPAKIFDDVKALVPSMDALTQMETQLNIDLKQDVLSKLSGAVTVEIDGNMQDKGTKEWRVILGLSDSDGLQKNLNGILETMHMAPKHDEQDGQTYYSVTLPSSPQPLDLNYAFVDGNLLFTPSHASVTAAVQAHRNKQSLAQSSDFRAALADQHSDFSALFYQNYGSMFAPIMKQLPPEMASLGMSLMQAKPHIWRVYADETSLRQVSNNAGTEIVAAVLIVGAIAIPNLIRAHTAANEAAAVGTLRTLNTAQITYETTYEDKGFAPNLATLGPGKESECSTPSAQYACLIDATLGCASETWCTKGAFRYGITTTCENGHCSDFTFTATPVDGSSGGRSFCSTTEGVLRYHSGAPVDAPLSGEECGSWTPL